MARTGDSRAQKRYNSRVEVRDEGRKKVGSPNKHRLRLGRTAQ